MKPGIFSSDISRYCCCVSCIHPATLTRLAAGFRCQTLVCEHHPDRVNASQRPWAPDNERFRLVNDRLATVGSPAPISDHSTGKGPAFILLPFSLSLSLPSSIPNVSLRDRRRRWCPFWVRLSLARLAFRFCAAAAPTWAGTVALPRELISIQP